MRYHGVPAPNTADRKQIVPGSKEEEGLASGNGELTARRRCYRLSWVVFLARVFRIEVTLCPDCGGRMKLIAVLTDPNSIRSYLEGVGLRSRILPIAPARPRAQPEFDYVS